MLSRARAFPQMPVSQSSGLGLDQRSTALETNSRMSPLTNSRIQYTIRLNTAARKGTLRQGPCRTPPSDDLRTKSPYLVMSHFQYVRRHRAGRMGMEYKPIVAALAALSLAALPVPSVAQKVAPDYLAGLKWRSIGPYRAGNISSVTGIPGDPTTYYVGTPEGGVWKTTSAGTVWYPVFDDAHVASIGAVAAAPSSPNTVYVGTGDPSGWSFSPGNGVYKTTDGGKTWRNIGLEKTRYINAIIVDPNNPNIVLVGAIGAPASGGPANEARGIYRTSDGGATWKRVLYKDAYTGVKNMTFDAA